MSLPFDPSELGLRPGESATVIMGEEPVHFSQKFGWHHDAWQVRFGEQPQKDHVSDPEHWGAWSEPWDACQPDFK